MARSEARRSRPEWLGIVDEAVASLTQRVSRTALACLGTTLGVGVLVAVLGLTATATSQIDSRFTALAATEVTITQAEVGYAVRTMAFPDDFASRINGITGVRNVGLTWKIGPETATVEAGALPTRAGDQSAALIAQTQIMAASPEALVVAHAQTRTGRLFDDYVEETAAHVALVGPTVAAELGIGSLQGRPAVRVGGTSFTVVGVLGSVLRHPELLNTVIVPTATARKLWGDPLVSQRPTGWVEVERGAGNVVAEQMAVATSPQHPDQFVVTPPPDPKHLRGSISSDLQGLFLILAVVCLIIGMVGIANTTFVTVMERVGEIGLRRSLGARRVHIAVQFLAEAAAIGLMGGFIGSLLGLTAVIGVSVSKDWTAVLPTTLVLAGPLIGAVTASVAALYPSLRGARIEPVAALRS